MSFTHAILQGMREAFLCFSGTVMASRGRPSHKVIEILWGLIISDEISPTVEME